MFSFFLLFFLVVFFSFVVNNSFSAGQRKRILTSNPQKKNLLPTYHILPTFWILFPHQSTFDVFSTLIERTFLKYFVFCSQTLNRVACTTRCEYTLWLHNTEKKRNFFFEEKKTKTKNIFEFWSFFLKRRKEIPFCILHNFCPFCPFCHFFSSFCILPLYFSFSQLLSVSLPIHPAIK